MKHFICWSIVAVGLALALSAQSATNAFEAISIKRASAFSGVLALRLSPRSRTFHSFGTVARLIEWAYDIGDLELIGGPDWARKEVFEVTATAAAESSNDEKRPLVQSLLAERFHLKVHRSQLQTRYLELTVASTDGQLGPKLLKCEGSKSPTYGPVLIPRGGKVSSSGCVPISAIARVSANVMNVIVVEKTGLPGNWSYALLYADPALTASSGVAPEGVVDPKLQPFGDALRDQLGLRLKPTQGQVGVLMLDSLEQPSDN
jgi:uncharacterized protein (TIGR03435 family)